MQLATQHAVTLGVGIAEGMAVLLEQQVGQAGHRGHSQVAELVFVGLDCFDAIGKAAVGSR